MKKITKIVASVLCLACMSVAFTGCEAKEKADNWFEKVFGWITPEEKDETPDDTTSTDDEDEENESGDGSIDNTNKNENNSSTSDTTDETENENTGVQNDPFIGSGMMYCDYVNNVRVRPVKTTVTVGETFPINVTKFNGDPIEENVTFGLLGNVSTETVTYAQLTVDENGNVAALSEGLGLVSVRVGDDLSYLVEITVIKEATDTDTYSLTATYHYEDCTIVISPVEAKIHVGDTFTVEASTTATDDLTITLREERNLGYVSLDGLSITAEKAGTTLVFIQSESFEYDYVIELTIIE